MTDSEYVSISSAVQISDKAVSDLMRISRVEGVEIIVRMNVDSFDIKTRAGHIQQHYNADELRELAEDNYCTICCCMEEPFSDRCADCSIYEFLKIVQRDGVELND